MLAKMNSSRGWEENSETYVLSTVSAKCADVNTINKIIKIKITQSDQSSVFD